MDMADRKFGNRGVQLTSAPQVSVSAPKRSARVYKDRSIFVNRSTLGQHREEEKISEMKQKIRKIISRCFEAIFDCVENWNSKNSRLLVLEIKNREFFTRFEFKNVGAKTKIRVHLGEVDPPGLAVWFGCPSGDPVSPPPNDL